MNEQKEDLVEIGKRLREVRDKLAKTVRQMSQVSGTSIGSISGMEKGRLKPTFPYLHCLVVSFNVNLNWVITGEGSMFPSAVELDLDFGKDNVNIQELIDWMLKDDRIRYEILLTFLKFKNDNPKLFET